MHLRSRLLTATGLAIIAANTAVASAAQEEPTLDQMLTKARITMAQAIDAATKAVKGGKAYSTQLVMNEGKPEYEVLLLVDGRHVLVDIDAEHGKAIVQSGTDEEGQGDESALDQVPSAVQATILREAAGGEIKDIETLYEAIVVKDGDELMMLVTEDGTLISESDPDDDEDMDEDEDLVLLVNAPLKMEPGPDVDWLSSVQED